MPRPVASLPEADPLFVDLNAARGETYGYALWKFGENGWQLAKDCSREGGVPGLPPSAPGYFSGQIRATASVPE
ncbi:MAG: hypothetical protein ACPHF4_08810 [Rubripirellula sp.]